MHKQGKKRGDLQLTTSSSCHTKINNKYPKNEEKKPLLLTYLDVTKEYDKAWLDGIMYALHNNGVIGPTWYIIRKLNQGLKAKIKTKDDMTRETRR